MPRLIRLNPNPDPNSNPNPSPNHKQVTCHEEWDACDTRVVSGGFVFSWSDEWHKGHASQRSAGPEGTEWRSACPDWSPDVHSPCGVALSNGQAAWNELDDFWNEEWFGMASVSPGCSSSEDEEAEEVAPPDRLSLRPVYYYLQAIWRY